VAVCYRARLQDLQHAYDKTGLWIGDHKKLVIPDVSAKVVQDSQPGEVLIYMEKEVSHHHHPPQSEWPIPAARRGMGCAVKLEGGSLLIGAYGKSGYKEGANNIQLVIHVPKDVEVERRPGLIDDGSRRAGDERNPAVQNLGPGGCETSSQRETRGVPCLLAGADEGRWVARTTRRSRQTTAGCKELILL
jgi:hypothetical protein